MALQVWLPLNKNGADKNQGLANINITSTATYNTSGKLGGSYYFSGSSNRISFPSQSWMTPNDTNSISIAMWVKADSFSYIIAANTFECSLSSSSFMFRLGNGSLNTFMIGTSGITFTTGTWYHLCGTWNAENKKLAVYVNGELINEGTSTLTSYNNISSTINLVYNGSWNINDFRFYDHCLSPKEVKEISKGLVLHYPLNDAYVEETNNLFTYPTPGSNCANSYGWDKTLHENAISVSGWSSGYNGGVEDPSTVYHAHWIMMDGLPTMRFPYITNSSGQTPVWLGISGYGLQPSDFISGVKYTVSFDAKADENNSDVSCGLYYKRNSSENWTFYDGNRTTTLTTDWKRYSVTYTSQGAYEISSFYFYGVCSGSKGNRYIRNVQLEIKDHATPYTPNTRNETTVYDCSGYQNNGTISGSLSCSANSSRYKISTVFDGISSKIINDSFPTSIISGTNSFTICGWAYCIKGNSYNPLFHIGSAYRDATGICLHGEGNRIEGLDINGTKIDNTYGSGYSNEKWVHQCIVYDGTTIKRYLNGNSTPIQSIACSGFKSDNNKLSVGGFWSVPFKGYLSDFRVYATALSAEDIKELYNTSCIINS